MTLESQSNPNITSNIRKNSPLLDIFLLLFKYILIIIMVIIINSYTLDNFIYAAIFGVITAFFLIAVIRDTSSIFYYLKARKYVNGVYLRGTKPQCPFLKVSASGFKCSAEFQRPFNMVDDFPRCHIESQFKEHWLEKNAGLLEHARKETSPLILRQLIEAIAVIKQPESSDFLLEIITTPTWSSMQNFFVKKLPVLSPIAESEFREIAINQFTTLGANIENKNKADVPLEVETGNNENQNKITGLTTEKDSQNIDKDAGNGKTKLESAYQQALNQFLSNKLVSLSFNQELIISSPQELYSKSMVLKARGNTLVQQYALQALGVLKDPRAIPYLLDLLGTDRRMDRIVVRILVSMGNKAIESLKSIVTDPNANQEKRYSAVEVLGMMQRKELYDFLLEIYLSTPQSDELMKSYLLTALGGSDPEQGVNIAIKCYYDKSEADLVQDAAKKIIIENISSCLPILFQKLYEFSEGELTDEQEYVRVNTVIIIEDMDLQLLKKWMAELGPTERSTYINIMNREGLELVAKRLKF